MMEPSKVTIKRTLDAIEHDSKHPTRRLAAGLIANHKVKHLPVEEIMRRYRTELDNLVGKH